MLSNIASSFRFYTNYYYDFAIDTWNHITPMQYGMVLVSIGVVGWVMMKSSLKK